METPTTHDGTTGTDEDTADTASGDTAVDAVSGDTAADTAGTASSERLDAEQVGREAAARSGIYSLLATLFDEPSESLHERLVAGEVDEACRELLDASGLSVEPPDLTVEDDHETLCARFNDLFTVGYSEYQDRTDGTLDSEGPPVSLYETAYRPEASWNDVNLDLARAYDYFGLEVDQSARDNHDYLPYQLEFAGYLARREAQGASDAARARLDFHDRHLHVLTGGLAGRMAEEAGTGLYGELAAFVDRFAAADQIDLGERFEGGEEP